MQLEYIKFRNMCGSNPLQIHLSQKLRSAVLLHFKDISIYIHIRNFVCE